MNAAALAIFGWFVPGGAYLLTRRYLQFAISALLVLTAFGAGLALHGGCDWPQPADLQGIDGFTALLFRAAALAKFLAGGPALIAAFSGDSGSFLAGRVHEYGATLLVMAGICNLLTISGAIELRREQR